MLNALGELGQQGAAGSQFRFGGLARGGDPDRAGELGVVLETRDHVPVQMGHHIAEAGHVHLVRLQNFAHGGLDGCVLTFYEDEDIDDYRVWDNWRLEGPAFVWYFRGSPHVHVWANVADSPAVKLNARG